MISTRDIPNYTRCKEPEYYKVKILEHLKKRCPKLDSNQKWVKPFCSQLTHRANNYLESLVKLSLKDLKDIAGILNIHRPGNTKKNVAESILDELIFCNNHETIYGESITEINPKKLFKTRNEYCHNIDELLAYLISSEDGNSEPKDENNVERLWSNKQQKQEFLENKFHDPQALKRYHQMVRSKAQQQQRGMNLDFFKYIELIGKLGFVYTNDESTSGAGQGFDASAKFLAHFTKVVEDAPPDIQEKIRKLKNFNESTVMENLNSEQCLHGIGSNLIKIYLYHFQKYKKKFPEIKLLPLFLGGKLGDGELYVATQFHGGKPFVKEVLDAKAGQYVFYLLYSDRNGKIIYTKRQKGPLFSKNVQGMQELLSEFDLV